MHQDLSEGWPCCPPRQPRCLALAAALLVATLILLLRYDHHRRGGDGGSPFADSHEAWMKLPGSESGIGWSIIDESLECRRRMAGWLRGVAHPCSFNLNTSSQKSHQHQRPQKQPAVGHHSAEAAIEDHHPRRAACDVYIAIVQQIVPSADWDIYSDPRQVAMIRHVISLNRKYW